MWNKSILLGWRVPAALFATVIPIAAAHADVGRAVRLLGVLERPAARYVLAHTAEGRAIGEFFTGAVVARAEERALLADRLSQADAEPFYRELNGKLLVMDRRFAEWQAAAPKDRPITELDRVGGISVMDRIYLGSMANSYLTVARRQYFTGEAAMETIQFVDRMGATGASYSVNAMEFTDWRAPAEAASALPN